MSLSKPITDNDWTTPGRIRPIKTKVSQEKKLFFLGNEDDRYAHEIIMNIMKKTMKHVEENPSLSNLFYKLSLIRDNKSGIEKLEKSFTQVMEKGLLQYLYTELGIEFFSVFLMLNEEGNPFIIFGKRGFRPEFMKSMTYVSGYKTLYLYEIDESLHSIELEEWRFHDTREDPVVTHPPLMNENEFPALTRECVPQESIQNSVFVGIIEIPLIEDLKSSFREKIISLWKENTLTQVECHEILSKIDNEP